MQAQLEKLVCDAIASLRGDGVLPADADIEVQVERSRQREHGDFATSAALALARPARRKPRELAELLVGRLPDSVIVDRVEIAGPGFINFFLTRDALYSLIGAIRSAGRQFGHGDSGAGRRVMVEFVSANPTGPLHVGHGRGAAYGDALARVLRAAGYFVHSEYYVNDAGRQMDILAVSVWLRYLELGGERFAFPDNCYRGDYVYDIAATVRREQGERFHHPAATVFDALPDDPEQRLDAMIRRSRELLGDGEYRIVFDTGLQALVDDIRADLRQFGVVYDEWYSERALLDNGAIERAVELLRRNGHLYEKDGATWFRATAFGDEKDRVLVRANGRHTYFAGDVAYHLDKAERGFELLINIWGADHHGYIKRVKAAFAAMGRDPEALTILLVQFAVLYRGGRKVSMSTRGGQFVTLRELREEVGSDAARFFYALRSPQQHMDFDLDLARSQSNDNPVYYVQYAHARVCSVFRQLGERGIAVDLDHADYALLVEDHELDLLRELSRFPEVVATAARTFEPHQVAYYLRELAQRFHTYYNAHPFIADEAGLRAARLGLVDAVRAVIANGLELLGVAAPESM